MEPRNSGPNPANKHRFSIIFVPMLNNRWLILLFMVGLFSPFHGLWAAGNDTTHIQNIRIEADGFQRGIRGILTTFDLHLHRHTDETEDAPIFHSDLGPYLIRAFITDPNGLQVVGTDDAPNYRNKEGYCRDSIRFIVPDKGEVFPNLQLFIPFYALDLRSGTYNLRVKLEMRDAETGKLVQGLDPIQVTIAKPALKLLRMSVKYFEVDSTDLSSGNWDYHLLSEDESRPDPEWKLMRGRFPVHSPRRLKNVFKYEGETFDLSPVFTLSEGDLLDVRVEDFDLTSSSDQIGSTTLNPWRDNFQFATYQTRNFGKVKDFTFTLFGVYLPELEIGKIRAEAGVLFEGVTGKQICLDFRKLGRPEAEKFFIELLHTIGAAEEVPQFVRVKAGPAHLDAQDHLILDADSGTVELFIPHYGVTQPTGLVPGFLRLSARVAMDGQSFTLMERLQRLPVRKPEEELADVKFHSYLIDMDKHGAHAGFRIVCELEIPPFYSEDVGEKEYRFRPGITFPSGPIDPAWIEYTGEVPGTVNGPELLLSPGAGIQRVEMFIPAHHFEQLPAGTVPVRLTAAVRMGREAEEWMLGTAETTMNLMIPTPDTIEVRIPELEAKKYPWMKDGANLIWRLRSGDQVFYQSPVVYNDLKPTWPSEIRAKIALYGGIDDVRLEVLHQGRGGMEHLLGVLKRGSEEWPTRVTEGMKTPLQQRKVKMPGVKKCVVEIRDTGIR